MEWLDQLLGRIETEPEGDERGDEIVMERDPVTGAVYQIINGERVPL